MILMLFPLKFWFKNKKLVFSSITSKVTEISSNKLKPVFSTCVQQWKSYLENIKSKCQILVPIKYINAIRQAMKV
jgi:hypothetical protein